MSNVKAHLKMRPTTETRKCWDQLTLVVNGTETAIPFIVFRDRDSALGLYHELAEAGINEQPGDITVTIDGRDVTFSESSRDVVLSVLDEYVTDLFDHLTANDDSTDLL